MGLFNFENKAGSPESGGRTDLSALVRSDADEITSYEEMKLFIKAIGDEYVQSKQLELSEEEWDRMSITDGAEMLSLYSWYHSKVVADDTEEKRSLSQTRMNRLVAAIVKKIINADEIYCLYNRSTGEPHLFSNTVRQGERYLCTPPDIRIYTKAYAAYQMKKYSGELFEMKKIENGTEGKAIENFLGESFYLNGATGVLVNEGQVSISAEMFVAPPDFTGMEQINIPVMNPDLMRWMLLMAQFTRIETDDEKFIYSLYHCFMSKEIVKARFLVPMKTKSGFPEAGDGTGQFTVKAGAEFVLAIMKGKYDRDAIIMYTDWKRLRECYDGWNGSIMTLEQIMSVNDAAINPTKHPKLGFYIGKDMYADIMKYVEQKRE